MDSSSAMRQVCRSETAHAPHQAYGVVTPAAKADRLRTMRGVGWAQERCEEPVPVPAVVGCGVDSRGRGRAGTDPRAEGPVRVRHGLRHRPTASIELPGDHLGTDGPQRHEGIDHAAGVSPSRANAGITSARVVRPARPCVRATSASRRTRHRPQPMATCRNRRESTAQSSMVGLVPDVESSDPAPVRTLAVWAPGYVFWVNSNGTANPRTTAAKTATVVLRNHPTSP